MPACGRRRPGLLDKRALRRCGSRLHSGIDDVKLLKLHPSPAERTERIRMRHRRAGSLGDVELLLDDPRR